jgi:DNA-binding SARP family transcriptional activator/tetratricopeptide (TPR) repeat protein
MLRLALLGAPVVERDSAPATFDTRKSIALLALVATSSVPCTRDGLAASLWPESDDAHARASLRRTLSVTAAAVGPALSVSRTAVGLERSQAWCDLWEFERLSESHDPESLAEAASLYRGDFLAGFRARAGAEFDHWHERTAEELRLRLGTVLSRLVDALVSGGTHDAALRHAQRWLSLDELHEPAHQALMRVLTWGGQRAAALAQYRRCVRVLEEELGVEPLTRTTALYEEIRADRLAPPPSAGEEVAVPHPGAASDGTGTDGDGPPVPFVGQGGVVAALAADLERCGSRGRAAVIAGTGGSGKTRIVEALADAAGPGHAWIRARCHPGEQWLELGCVAALLRAAFSCDPDLARRLGPRDAAEVARVVPEVDTTHEAVVPLDTPGAQVRFFEAVTSALSSAARRDEPGVLVVENAQHIDETSARLLAYMMRRLDELPALVVVTWQPESGVPRSLGGVLDELRSAGRCTVYEPSALGIDDVSQVLEAQGLPRSLAGELLERTGGLPLLVVAYTKALRERTGEGADQEAPGALPPGVPTAVRPLLQERLATISETASQVVAAAAVLGSDFDAELLRTTSGRSAIEVADALDEAIVRGLLVERPSAGPGSPAYEFPYDALRVVAYESCGRARRRLLHGRAADALSRRAEEIGGSALFDAVSAHLEGAGRPEAAEQWRWRAAQRSLSLFARDEALDHLRRALELGHPATESHLAIADVLIGLGRYREALTQLEQAAADDPSTGPALAQIEHRLAAVQGRIGNWEIAAAHLDAALAAVDDPALRARVLADRAFVAHRCGDPAAGIRAARALEEARTTGDATALAQAHNVTGVLDMLAGRSDAAECSLRASLEAAESLDDPGPAVAALNNLARLLAELGRDEEAFATAQEALRRGEEHGDVHRLAALHSNLADLLHAAGRSEESIAHLKDAASAFAGVDAGDGAVPGVWTLTEW